MFTTIIFRTFCKRSNTKEIPTYPVSVFDNMKKKKNNGNNNDKKKTKTTTNKQKTVCDQIKWAKMIEPLGLFGYKLRIKYSSQGKSGLQTTVH